MAGRTITDLPKPPRRFSPAHSCDRPHITVSFETKEKAKEEDQRRREGVDSVRKKGALGRQGPPVGSTKQLRALAKAIRYQSTPASSRYMRKHRIRIAGALWALIEGEGCKMATFTLLPRRWEFQGGQLHQADPNKLLAQLRIALHRAGASKANGWLFIGLHGEHEPAEDVYVLHAHGLAVGDMINVVDRLRHTGLARSVRVKGANEKVFQRVRLSRAPLRFLPEPLTYVLQGFWPERTRFQKPDGGVARQRRKRRIEEPRHTEVLLWLNRWRLNELTLLVGIRATAMGFRRTRFPYANQVTE